MPVAQAHSVPFASLAEMCFALRRKEQNISHLGPPLPCAKVSRNMRLLCKGLLLFTSAVFGICPTCPDRLFEINSDLLSCRCFCNNSRRFRLVLVQPAQIIRFDFVQIAKTSDVVSCSPFKIPTFFRAITQSLACPGTRTSQKIRRIIVQLFAQNVPLLCTACEKDDLISCRKKLVFRLSFVQLNSSFRLDFVQCRSIIPISFRALWHEKSALVSCKGVAPNPSAPSPAAAGTIKTTRFCVCLRSLISTSCDATRNRF